MRHTDGVPGRKKEVVDEEVRTVSMPSLIERGNPLLLLLESSKVVIEKRLISSFSQTLYKILYSWFSTLNMKAILICDD